jgi:hypothetical protein
MFTKKRPKIIIKELVPIIISKQGRTFIINNAVFIIVEALILIKKQRLVKVSK